MVAEHLAHRAHLLEIAHRRAGAVGIEIVDAAVAGAGHGQAHAAHRALARRGDHVVTVAVGGVADDLGVDGRAPGQGPVHVLEHHHAGAAGDDEAVAVDVVGPAGPGGGGVEVARHGAHGVEQV